MPGIVGEEAFGDVSVAGESDGLVVTMGEVLVGSDDLVGDFFDRAFLPPTTEVGAEGDSGSVDLVAHDAAGGEGLAFLGMPFQSRDRFGVGDLGGGAEGFRDFRSRFEGKSFEVVQVFGDDFRDRDLKGFAGKGREFSKRGEPGETILAFFVIAESGKSHREVAEVFDRWFLGADDEIEVGDRFGGVKTPREILCGLAPSTRFAEVRADDFMVDFFFLAGEGHAEGFEESSIMAVVEPDESWQEGGDFLEGMIAQGDGNLARQGKVRFGKRQDLGREIEEIFRPGVAKSAKGRDLEIGIFVVEVRDDPGGITLSEDPEMAGDGLGHSGFFERGENSGEVFVFEEEVSGMRADVDRRVIKRREEAGGRGEVNRGLLEWVGALARDAVDSAADLVRAPRGIVVEVTQEERAIGADEQIGGEEVSSFFAILELNEILMFPHLDSALGQFWKAGHDLFPDHAGDKVGAFETEGIVLDEDVSGG